MTSFDGGGYEANRAINAQQKEQRSQYHRNVVMGGGQQQAGGQPYAGQGLPPTGLQKQLAGINSYYDAVQSAKMNMAGAQTSLGGMTSAGEKNIGFDPYEHQYQQFQQQGGEQLFAAQVGTTPGQAEQEASAQGRAATGGTNLNQMARSLAEDYGLPIGRGDLVDEYGNFKVTPDQLAAASGGSETLGSAAVKMNYISDAIARKTNEDRKQAGIQTMQMGLGQLSSRARGSLAQVQSGMYQALAQQYQASADYEGADFSYYILKEKQDIEAELQRRQEKQLKRQARTNTIMGVVNVAAGAYSGNIGQTVQGVGQVASSYEETGWF